MKNILLVLVATSFIIGCGKTIPYVDNGSKFENSRFPITIYVSKEKYNDRKFAFDKVEKSLKSESGKKLINFIPKDNNPKFENKWDSSSLYTNNSEFWLLFKENSSEFTNVGKNSAAQSLVWKQSNGTINSANIIMNFDGHLWTNQAFTQILFHETLHVLGFNHTQGTDYSVMNYGWTYWLDGLSGNDKNRLSEKYNFALKESSIKDLESMGANLESLDNEELSYKLEENYGLSEKRAASVAKITSSFQKIQNKRALTAKEMNIYTQKVLGVDYTASKKALEKHIQGDSSEMEALMERAAELNNTSPEAVQDLVGEYLLK